MPDTTTPRTTAGSSVPPPPPARSASTSRSPRPTAPSSRPSKLTTRTAPSSTSRLVRITAPGRLVVNRVTVEDRLGREWETHEFQMAIVSYFGHIQDWDDDEIVIAWDH